MSQPVEATWGKVGKCLPISSIVEISRMPGKYLGDDEGTWYTFTLTPSDITLDPEQIEKIINQYQTDSNIEVEVTITPDTKQLKSYPDLLVKIDDKWYDKGILSKPITFLMTKDHRVSLWWDQDNIEIFRISKKV